MAYTMLPNKLITRNYEKESLEGAAIGFIRENCEGLRFDTKKASDLADGNKDRDGKSIKKNQIPYNMEKDIDRLCLENALDRFLRSGKKEDAFDVYFCYIEMFVGSYGASRRLIELLSEFESNGSGLLMKHRDHYSHSVYVFALGLAVFRTNSDYRDVYFRFYQKDEWSGRDCCEMAHHFLKYWGLSSLFHDIGYPFELPFEQIESYFEVSKEERKNNPFLSFNNLRTFTELDYATVEKLGRIYPGTSFESTNEVFAHAISARLSGKYNFTEGKMIKWLEEKPTKPNQFGYFMDHGFFSATLLLKNIFNSKGEKKDDILELDLESLDAMAAVLMHNSLFKFCINGNGVSNYRKTKMPLEMKDHPLAFMLMLCDELQCWDRTAYGRNSKLQIHPMNVQLDLSENGIHATYLFDEKDSAKVEVFKKKYEAYKAAPLDERGKAKKEPELKAYAGMYKKEKGTLSDFESDIRCIVKLEKDKFTADTQLVPRDPNRGKTSLSSSRFINLYNFAVILNARWRDTEFQQAFQAGNAEIFIQNQDKEKEYDAWFGEMSLEYKLSNINQAKGFADCLDAIGCFYTDEDIDRDIVEAFSGEDLLRIGEIEHKRWLQEHYDMGWCYGVQEGEARELTRAHKDMLPFVKEGHCTVSDADAGTNYDRLEKAEQDKDTEPMKCMLAMLGMFDGLRIYRL